MSSNIVPRTDKALRSRLVFLLLTVLLVGISVVVRAKFFPSGESEHHHGGIEEAPGELANHLDTLSEGERLPFLLKSVDDEHAGFRYAVVDALGREKGATVAEAVENAFHDSASTVRVRVVEVLPDVDAVRGSRLLLTALKDEDTWVRDAAASQLGIRLSRKTFPVDERTVPTLISALRDTNRNIPAFAITSLRKLTGKPWRVRATASASEQERVRRQWETWWATEGKVQFPSTDNVAAIHSTRADLAPAYDMKDWDGKKITRDGQKGRVTLLNFWGSWCPPCQLEVPELNIIHNEFQAKGVDVVGIALSEKDERSLRDYCKTKPVHYRQVMATEKVLEDFGHIHDVPVTVLIDAKGQIRNHWEGERDATTFRPAIQRLLSEN